MSYEYEENFIPMSGNPYADKRDLGELMKAMRQQFSSQGTRVTTEHFTNKRDIDACLADFERQMKEGR